MDTTKIGDFTTVFEITGDSGSSDVFALLFGIILFILGIVILFVRRKSQKRWLEKFYVPVFLLVFGLLLFFINVSDLKAHRNTTHELITAYKTERYRTAEGRVHVLHEQPVGGHAKGDVIEIDGIKLTINYFVRTPAYHRTISHGGVLKEGVYAKVYYYKGKILRIDIRNDDNYRQTIHTPERPNGRIEINEGD